ncbi:MAG: glutamine synthetase III [Lachnospiraceae bacterium]|nr:glutamine synthetase III [Lachnospiraceae bacterium]
MNSLAETFGSYVFSDDVMKERLPREIFEALLSAREFGKRLRREEADVVAGAMKDWALEKGATHFTHWFQPMTGITAEKHEAFLTPSGTPGKALPEFSGKELIQGEPDASSFPSGGLRATFEARGYTAWDPTSYAFVKDQVLCIPTAFCSYGGEAIDKKTPLLRSMDALNKQALRVLRLFGDEETTAVRPMVGAEQEYFLVDRDMFRRRRDLVYTGRTLIGTRPPKGQELDDHYFGAIKPRVAAFMAELDDELWKLGVPAKTEHNEAAPAQHELASVYNTANVAADQNQLVMERMKRIADRHGMVCLLHEKPFAGVNGSGKHDNWSLATNTGKNLLNPGETPAEDAQFLLFLAAVIEAVDEYQDLLRISVASAGNDHRLGGNEAPPAILSIFLGQELTEILNSIEMDIPYESREKVPFKVGVHVLPRFNKDSTDRNRTTPFAFTGNKFEFRMVGSSASVSEANIVLNTAVAEILCRFADELEGASDFDTALHGLIRRVVREHRRIIFNGNGYDEAWVREAAQRGLSNYRTTPECLPHLLDEKNLKLFTSLRVFNEVELRARYEIMMESYAKEVKIEAITLLDMIRKDVLPAESRFCQALANAALSKRQLLGESAVRYETDLLQKLTELTERCWAEVETLSEAVDSCKNDLSAEVFADICAKKLLPSMQALRLCCDEMENYTDKKYWPYPSYGEILFSVY